MNIIRRFIGFLRRVFSSTPESAASIRDRRGFLKLAAGIAAIAQTAPLMLLEPAKAAKAIAGVTSSLGAYTTLEERIFFQIIMSGTDSDLLPNVPYAADGAILYSTTERGIDWTERVL